MSFTTTVYGVGDKPFKAVVDYGKETVHPDSPHRAADSLTDPQVPPELIIKCSPKGAVSVFDFRSPEPKPGKRTKRKVAAKKISKTWAVVPSQQGQLVLWHENWVRIPCYSYAHCNHIIDLLSQDHIPSNLDPVIV